MIGEGGRWPGRSSGGCGVPGGGRRRPDELRFSARLLKMCLMQILRRRRRPRPWVFASRRRGPWRVSPSKEGSEVAGDERSVLYLGSLIVAGDPFDVVQF